MRDGVPTPQALAAVRILENAREKGLDPADYGGLLWSDRIAALRDARGAGAGRFDADLTAALVRYAGDLHHGRVAPRTLGFDLDAAKPPLDAPALVAEAALSPDPGAVFARVEPAHQGYARLLAALARYRALAASPPLPPLPVGSSRVDLQACKLEYSIVSPK